MRMTYHGWIVRNQHEGYSDTWHVEFFEDGKRVQRKVSSPVEAIEFFEQRLGKFPMLIETPLGAYRVYTNEEKEGGYHG